MKFDEFKIYITINGSEGKQRFELEESHKTHIVMMILQNHFECARCGACCTTATKNIAIYDVDIPVLAEDLHMSKMKFKKKYLSNKVEYTPVDRLPFYRMKLPCPFYNKEIRGCNIYKLSRPIICRTHPIEDKWVPGLTEYMWGDYREGEDCPASKDQIGTTPEQWLIMKVKKQNNCDDEIAKKIIEDEIGKTLDKYIETLEKLDKLKEIGICRE
ncbi:MAG: YkgJ family cysteine cluster protein [Acidobacteriia bacterium]|nr:YkgJ family cysteine cluster protein [Terriglobia bacterium]